MGQTWKKAIWKRNFLFWGKYALQMVEILIGFTVGYGILFSLTDDGAFFSTGFFYAALIGMMFAWMEPFAYTGAYLPLVLSFGSGRREAVLGAQIQHFLTDVLMYLVILAASVLSGHPQGALVYVGDCHRTFFPDRVWTVYIDLTDPVRRERNRDQRDRYSGRTDCRNCCRTWIFGADYSMGSGYQQHDTLDGSISRGDDFPDLISDQCAHIAPHRPHL